MNTTALIAVNPTQNEMECNLGKGTAVMIFTNDEQNLAHFADTGLSNVKLTARSVNTLVWS